MDRVLVCRSAAAGKATQWNGAPELRLTTETAPGARARPGGIHPVTWTARIFRRSRPKILTTKPTHSHLTTDPHVSSLLELEPKRGGRRN
jgi:hypothetical protein